MTNLELQIQRQKELDEYKKSLEGKTVDELKAIEQDLIKEIDNLNEKASTSEYDLPKVDYKKTAEEIRMLLDAKVEILWQHCAGMVVLYEFWDPEKAPEKISFPILDTTLRVLGGELRYKGYTEWKAIVDIIKYIEPLQVEWRKVDEENYNLAMHHDILIKTLEIKAPVEIQEKDPAPVTE
jgi:hypothetical protein